MLSLASPSAPPSVASLDQTILRKCWRLAPPQNRAGYLQKFTDSTLVDYLKKEKFDYFDMNEALINDYRKANTNLSYDEYVKKYMVNGHGHFNPLGNHFFAYSLKDKIIDWLDPKPMTYQNHGSKIVDEHYFFDARPGSMK